MVCFKVMRLTSEFLRHAEKHVDVSQRKRAFIMATCDELRERSDTQLDLASKKRSARAAGLDSEHRVFSVESILS